MKYLKKDKVFIYAQCDDCGKELKISRAAVAENKDGYKVRTYIKCYCGHEDNQITKKSTQFLSKLGNMLNKAAEAGREVQEEKRRKADEPIRCPKCGSTQITSGRKGFSTGKAVVGDLVAGPVGGLLLGGKGSNKIMVTCLKCGHQWKAGKGK